MDPIPAFGAACESYEDKTTDTLMSTCWKLLGDILRGPRDAGLSPGAQQQACVDAMLQVRRQGGEG